MAGAEFIKVSIEQLHALESSVLALPTEAQRAVQANLTSSALVSSVHTDIQNDWDEKRQVLVETLKALADTIGAIRGAFEQADTALAEMVSP